VIVTISMQRDRESYQCKNRMRHGSGGRKIST
jgi:hypothetical protein